MALEAIIELVVILVECKFVLSIFPSVEKDATKLIAVKLSLEESFKLAPAKINVPTLATPITTLLPENRVATKLLDVRLDDTRLFTVLLSDIKLLVDTRLDCRLLEIIFELEIFVVVRLVFNNVAIVEDPTAKLELLIDVLVKSPVFKILKVPLETDKLTTLEFVEIEFVDVIRFVRILDDVTFVKVALVLNKLDTVAWVDDKLDVEIVVEKIVEAVTFVTSKLFTKLEPNVEIDDTKLVLVKFVNNPLVISAVVAFKLLIVPFVVLKLPNDAILAKIAPDVIVVESKLILNRDAIVALDETKLLLVIFCVSKLLIVARVAFRFPVEISVIKALLPVKLVTFKLVVREFSLVTLLTNKFDVVKLILTKSVLMIFAIVACVPTTFDIVAYVFSKLVVVILICNVLATVE